MSSTTENKWDVRYLALAKEVASWSKDPSTQTGAVIVGPDNKVISVGFNGFPKGMSDDPELYANREEKYSRIVHCEMNAVLSAGKLPEGCTLYTHPFISCDRCAVHMLQAGIKRFIAPKPTAEQLTRWAAAFAKTKQYVRECGAKLTEVE